MLAHFGIGHPKPDPLIERSEQVAEVMKDLDGQVRIIVTRNRRAHDALRRLDSHARR